MYEANKVGMVIYLIAVYGLLYLIYEVAAYFD